MSLESAERLYAAPASRAETERRNAQLEAVLHAYRREISDLRRRLFRQQDERAASLLNDHRRAETPPPPQQAEPETASTPTRGDAPSDLEDALRQALEAANARADAFQMESERRGHLLEALLGSTSWRITRPIRGLKRLITGR